VIKDRKVLPEIKVRQERQGHRVLQGLLEIKVRRELLVRQVHKEIRARKEKLVHKDHRVLQDHKVAKVNPD
jgi:hypothetical protein